ncbi:MAG: hypothetical protein LIR50_05760 [Bacillota bacterium]|nr:hypothetical protein [Bacillota bacterium]
MKFYEFNNFEYYALVGANTVSEAKNCYNELVCELDEYCGEPEEITRGQAKKKLEESCEDNAEKIEMTKEFKHNENVEGSFIVLIDGCLI